MCCADLLADSIADSLQFLHSFESEKSFSFTSTDDIHSVATLLKVSHCNHSKRVVSLSSSLALPLRSSSLCSCSLFKHLAITQSIEVSNLIANRVALFVHMWI